MSCKQYRKDLMPWIDGELTPQRSSELQAWFASCQRDRQCTACQTQISEYRALQKAMSSLPSSELPAHVHHRIMDTLKQTAKSRSRQTARYRWQAIPVAVAVMVSLYFGSLVSSKTFSTDTSETTASTELYSFGESSLAEVFVATEVTP